MTKEMLKKGNVLMEEIKELENSLRIIKEFSRRTWPRHY